MKLHSCCEAFKVDYSTYPPNNSLFYQWFRILRSPFYWSLSFHIIRAFSCWLPSVGNQIGVEKTWTSLNKEDSLQNWHSDVSYDTSVKFICLVTFHAPLFYKFSGLSSQQNKDTWKSKTGKWKCYKWFNPFSFITHALAKIKGKYKGLAL